MRAAALALLLFTACATARLREPGDDCVHAAPAPLAYEAAWRVPPLELEYLGQVSGQCGPGRQCNVSTLLTSATGSNSLVTIGPFNDRNTGLWFPAADTINLTTGGALAVQITSGQRVILNSGAAGIQNGTALWTDNGTTSTFSHRATNAEYWQAPSFYSGTVQMVLESGITDASATSTNPAYKLLIDNSLTAGDLALAINHGGANTFFVTAEGGIGSTSTKMRGEIALASGAGSATVAAGSFCVCQDESASPNVTQCVVSGSTLNVTQASGSHTVSYICVK